MSGSEPTTEQSLAAPSDTEGAQRAIDRAQQQQVEQQEALTEAEKQKRRLMEAKRSETVFVDVEANDVSVDIEFRTLNGPAKDLIEEIGIRFGDVDEDEAASRMAESGDMYLENRARFAAMLADHAVDEAYDEQFFTEFFGGGERMSILGDIADAESSGN